MKRFVDGVDRSQGLLLPDRLEDYVHEDNPVRVVDAFVDALDLSVLGCGTVDRAAGGRPAYHPAALLKIYIYGFLNRIQSSRRLEREAQRNLELIWLTGRLAPDFKTIADFRRNNGTAIMSVCSRFIALCRNMKVFSHAVVAIDGSKLKAVNSRERNFTIHRFTTEENGLKLHKYWSSACPDCPMRTRCTTSNYRRVGRWEHEHVLEAMQFRLNARPQVAILRKQTVEHVFGTLKAWLGTTPLLTKTLPKVRTEISLAVLAYNMKRMIKIVGMQGMLRAIAA